jgi:hypothetical protein
MRRPLIVLLVVAAILGLAVAGCGGESEGEGEGERGEAFGPICELTQLSGATGLPTDFPLPADVTFVKAEDAGPSRIVEGFVAGGLEDVYDEWHGAFEDSDYDITFDEREDHDAEISFEGGGRSGQVKLADECGEGKVYARVTSRPE